MLHGLRRFLTVNLIGLAMLASPIQIACAQNVTAEASKMPQRLPKIDKQVLDRLPPGCTSTWGNVEQHRATASNAPSDLGARQNGSVIRNASPSKTASLYFPASHALNDSKQIPAPDSDSLLPMPRTDSTLLETNTGDDLLPSEQVKDDALLNMNGTDEADPLSGMGLSETNHRSKPRSSVPDNAASGRDKTSATTHPLESMYPSAQTCAKCHPKHYDEWRMSSHAYASISPMFQRFEQAMQELTEGTVGSFCVRCHAPVATQLCIPPSATILDAPPVVREGITCVACHRVNESIGRTNGDRRIEPGDIHSPIYGSSTGQGVRDASAKAKELKLKLNADEKGPGQPMHQHCGPFEPITRSDFCASCHQVAVHPGIWLEIVHAQFRSGPAAAKGITCQDCHMGSVPGKPSGYEIDHCAEILEKPFGEPRKHSNHVFWGPGYSIAHPGIFPHNPKADKYTTRQWLSFEYRAGWGTKEFEKTVEPGTHFPPPWDNADERITGRKIIDANLEKLEEKRGIAALTLAAGGRVAGPHLDGAPTTSYPLRFNYRVTNISEGHNMPTGSLGAQPQMWLNVALIDPNGTRVWETGYLDGNGDLADLQSVDVNNHRMPRDSQLFNLQTKFLINNGLRGTDREAPVPLNFSVDQLAFLRPGAVPVSVLNHPPLIRMEAHSIAPLDHRIAHYVVPAEKMMQPGLYRLSSRLRSRPEPPYFMRLVGASPEMIRRLNENIIDFEISSHTFVVQDPVSVAMPKKFLLR